MQTGFYHHHGEENISWMDAKSHLTLPWQADVIYTVQAPCCSVLLVWISEAWFLPNLRLWCAAVA